MSILDRIRKAFSAAAVPVEAPPQTTREPAETREPGGMEATAAAVALAIDRGRRTSRSMTPPFEIAETAGPDEWATSGRLAQVDRFPTRDPWNK
jgi:hypothetical protein